MIDGSSLLTFAHQPFPNGNCDLRYTTLRRKSAYLWDSARGAGSGYPSPPMSSPPSPKRRTSDLTLPSTLSQQIVPAATAPTSVSTPAHSLEQTTTSIASLGITQAGHPAYHPPASFVTGSGAVPLTSAAGQYYSAAYAPPALTAAQTTPQASRKAKSHVASACVNCKRAHLSCDVQRPCARCISSGKQVSTLAHCIKELSDLARILATMSHTRSEADLDYETKANSDWSGPCRQQRQALRLQHR